MTELDRETFARGVSDAIRALRAVYAGVRAMLEEFSETIRQDPQPLLYDLGVRPASRTSKAHPDEKILRSWMGRFYQGTPTDTEPDDEGDDDGEDPKRFVTFSAGSDLAFAKAVLYDRQSETGEPHLLVGVLRNCQVGLGWEALDVQRWQLRKVLEEVRHDTALGPVKTKAGAKWPRSASRVAGGNRLVFQLTEEPMRFPLFDLRGPEQVREVAVNLKGLWAGTYSPRAGL